MPFMRLLVSHICYYAMLYLYIYFVRNDNMLTVDLNCDIIKLLPLIGRYVACLVSVTVFRYARRISSDQICICFFKGGGGGLIAVFCFLYQRKFTNLE